MGECSTQLSTSFPSFEKIDFESVAPELPMCKVWGLGLKFWAAILLGACKFSGRQNQIVPESESESGIRFKQVLWYSLYQNKFALSESPVLSDNYQQSSR